MLSLVFSVAVSMASLDGDHRVEPARFGDFGAYWVAGRCLVEGRDCHDPRQVELVAARQDVHQAFVTWNPPWALLPFALLALLPFPAAALVWTGLSAALVAWVGIVVGRRWGLSDFWSVVLSITFVPVGACLGISQLSILVLAGVVGYREFCRQDKPILGGACLALASIKPHLVALVWIAAALAGTWRQRVFVLSGMTLTIAFASSAVLMLEPRALANYALAVANPSPTFPTNYFSAAPAMWLRWVVEECFHKSGWVWISYVPITVGMIAIAWMAARKAVDDDRLFDRALVLSSVAAPYSWLYDHAILLPAYLSIWSVIRERKVKTVALATAAVAIEIGFAVAIGMRAPESWYFPVPLLLAALLFATRTLRTTNRDEEEGKWEPGDATSVTGGCDRSSQNEAGRQPIAVRCPIRN